MNLLTQSLDALKQARPYLSAALAWLRRGDRRSWRKAGRG